MTHAFAETGLEMTAELELRLQKDGFTTPTPVQRSAIPSVLAGRDVVIQSGTGTGKTLAYVLPLVERARRDASFRAVIVAPSPELAMQILHTVEAYKGPNVRSASLVGSGNISRQKEKLKQHPQLLVGTPGRVLELIFARKVQTKTIKALVLDEIDQVLSPENNAGIREICSRPEFQSQIIAASATIGKRAEAFNADFMDKQRLRLQLDRSPLRQDIEHFFYLFADKRGEVALARLIKDIGIDAALVFVHKSFWVPKLFHTLRDHGISCVTLSAAGNKEQRRQALDTLKQREARVLVATDAAARGLDIKDLDWVIHFELANDNDSYLHRTGRTGRAARTGTSIVMVTRDEFPRLERQARELRITIRPLDTRASG